MCRCRRRSTRAVAGLEIDIDAIAADRATGILAVVVGTTIGVIAFVEPTTFADKWARSRSRDDTDIDSHVE